MKRKRKKQSFVSGKWILSRDQRVMFRSMEFVLFISLGLLFFSFFFFCYGENVNWNFYMRRITVVHRAARVQHPKNVAVMLSIVFNPILVYIHTFLLRNVATMLNDCVYVRMVKLQWQPGMTSNRTNSNRDLEPSCSTVLVVVSGSKFSNRNSKRFWNVRDFQKEKKEKNNLEINASFTTGINMVIHD